MLQSTLQPRYMYRAFGCHRSLNSPRQFEKFQRPYRSNRHIADKSLSALIRPLRLTSSPGSFRIDILLWESTGANFLFERNYDKAKNSKKQENMGMDPIKFKEKA